MIPSIMHYNTLCLNKGLTRLYAETVFIEPCVYCGQPADSIDHIPPRSLRSFLPEIGLVAKEQEVHACRECNCVLGARPILTIGERRAFVKLWLKKRYRKYLHIPSWTQTDLAELSPTLRKYVERGLTMQYFIKQRLQWPNTH